MNPQSRAKVKRADSKVRPEDTASLQPMTSFNPHIQKGCDANLLDQTDKAEFPLPIRKNIIHRETRSITLLVIGWRAILTFQAQSSILTPVG